MWVSTTIHAFIGNQLYSLITLEVDLLDAPSQLMSL